METAERLCQIDQENIEKSLKVVDNGMNVLSERIYSLNHILSSALDLVQGDLDQLDRRASCRERV